MMLGMLALITSDATAAVTHNCHAAHVEVWDCQHPMGTAIYNGRNFCESVPQTQNHQQQQQVMLAQVVKRHRAEGFKCEAVRTTSSHICEAFLYEKALPSLTSTTQLQLLESDCCKIFYDGMFCDPETGHKECDIKGVGVFHFSTSLHGVVYITGGDTACQWWLSTVK